MKKYFWFLFQPQDEREDALFAQAFQRGSFVWMYLVINLLFNASINNLKVPQTVALVVIVCIIAYVSGVISFLHQPDIEGWGKRNSQRAVLLSWMAAAATIICVFWLGQVLLLR